MICEDKDKCLSFIHTVKGTVLPLTTFCDLDQGQLLRGLGFPTCAQLILVGPPLQPEKEPSVSSSPACGIQGGSGKTGVLRPERPRWPTAGPQQ